MRVYFDDKELVIKMPTEQGKELFLELLLLGMGNNTRHNDRQFALIEIRDMLEGFWSDVEFDGRVTTPANNANHVDVSPLRKYQKYD